MPAKKKKNILTPKEQEKIHKLYTVNQLSMKELATEFNHSVSGIKAIIHNRESKVYHSRNLLGRNEDFVKDSRNEVWKKMKIDTKHKYEISNYGRIKSYATNPEGNILKGKLHSGYLVFDYTDIKEGVLKHALVHRLVALHFIGKPPAKKNNVIHLDGDKANNRVENLQYMTAEETGRHYTTNNPVSEMNAKRQQNRTKGHKLTLTQVETIRKILSNPNSKTKKKVLAQRYNISEMTLYRIQNGDLWGSKGTPIDYVKKELNLLPDKTVIEIKKLLLKKKLSQKAIAAKYGLTETIISRIKQGKTYKDVEIPS